MSDDFRVRLVRETLNAFVVSPSLEHIRDNAMLNRLASEIVATLFRGSPVWRKWDLTREAFLRRAIPCWVPVADMTAFLNDIEGPVLTTTDVEARMNAMCEERFESYPDVRLKDFCLEIYRAEVERGTELAAIVECILERSAEKATRDYEEARERGRLQRVAAAAALESQFLSGADCKWTPLRDQTGIFCRLNGRAFRLRKASDGKQELHRIIVPDDAGTLIGRYGARGDASRVLKDVAYR